MRSPERSGRRQSGNGEAIHTDRRRFIHGLTLAGAMSAIGMPGVVSASLIPAKPVWSKSLEILVLGGTGFIGPHMVREALRRGHSVCLFNRGRTNNALFPDLETIQGDRAGDLQGLRGRRFDAVIDNSGYMPQHVGMSADLLADQVGQYLFVSSISAYASFAQPNDEASQLASIDTLPDEFSWENYGALKALCEQAATREIGANRTTILRPTYICGPGDHTDRFTYWPVRIRRGGDMLWPGSSSHPIQIIDVRDLANFVVDCIERRIVGVYNTVTPVGSYSMGALLEDGQAVTASGVNAVWVDDAFVASSAAGDALPIYHPVSGEYAHASSISGERAREAGLGNRPVRETIRDLMAWWDTLPPERIEAARFAMTPDREAGLIAAWRESKRR